MFFFIYLYLLHVYYIFHLLCISAFEHVLLYISLMVVHEKLPLRDVQDHPPCTQSFFLFIVVLTDAKYVNLSRKPIDKLENEFKYIKQRFW